MPVFLLSNWRFIAIAGAVLVVFLGGMHYQSLIDAHHADELVQAQQEVNALAQAERNRKAKVAELELAAERTKSAELADQWENERHATNHLNCALSAASIRVLQSATSK